MTVTKQIIAVGGGGFLQDEVSSPNDSALEEYIVGSPDVERPRICFIPTANADSPEGIARFYKRFAALKCEASHLELFKRTEIDLERFIFAQNIIYVGGGNTANMLAIWSAHGLDSALRRAYAEGVVMSGVSAGAICWFEAGVTDSFGPNLVGLNCLGLVQGSHCPHYDSEPQRRITYHQLIREGLPGGIAADDGCAIHFVDGKLLKIVSARPDARAYEVFLKGNELEERPLQVELLSTGAV